MNFNSLPHVSHLLNSKPLQINFIKNRNLNDSYRLLKNICFDADWYAIIASMILQYDHVYADVSYIIHSKEIIPLLKHTLQNATMKHRILFGTDFYVMRNHLSEREMLINSQAWLTEDEFDLIARENPVSYLNTLFNRKNLNRELN